MTTSIDQMVEKLKADNLQLIRDHYAEQENNIVLSELVAEQQKEIADLKRQLQSLAT